MRKILITIIFALLAIITAIALSPNKPSEDWERFIHGGDTERAPKPHPTPEADAAEADAGRAAGRG